MYRYPPKRLSQSTLTKSSVHSRWICKINVDKKEVCALTTVTNHNQHFLRLEHLTQSSLPSRARRSKGTGRCRNRIPDDDYGATQRMWSKISNVLKPFMSSKRRLTHYIILSVYHHSNDSGIVDRRSIDGGRSPSVHSKKSMFKRLSKPPMMRMIYTYLLCPIFPTGLTPSESNDLPELDSEFVPSAFWWMMMSNSTLCHSLNLVEKTTAQPHRQRLSLDVLHLSSIDIDFLSPAKIKVDIVRGEFYYLSTNRVGIEAGVSDPPAFSEAWNRTCTSFGVARGFDTGLRSSLLPPLASNSCRI